MFSTSLLSRNVVHRNKVVIFYYRPYYIYVQVIRKYKTNRSPVLITCSLLSFHFSVHTSYNSHQVICVEDTRVFNTILWVDIPVFSEDILFSMMTVNIFTEDAECFLNTVGTQFNCYLNAQLDKAFPTVLILLHATFTRWAYLYQDFWHKCWFVIFVSNPLCAFYCKIHEVFFIKWAYDKNFPYDFHTQTGHLGSIVRAVAFFVPLPSIIYESVWTVLGPWANSQ